MLPLLRPHSGEYTAVELRYGRRPKKWSRWHTISMAESLWYWSNHKLQYHSLYAKYKHTFLPAQKRTSMAFLKMKAPMYRTDKWSEPHNAIDNEEVGPPWLNKSIHISIRPLLLYHTEFPASLSELHSKWEIVPLLEPHFRTHCSALLGAARPQPWSAAHWDKIVITGALYTCH